MKKRKTEKSGEEAEESMNQIGNWIRDEN